MKKGFKLVIFLFALLYLSQTEAQDAGSCASRCNEDYEQTNSCHCDDQCAKRNDCCADFIPQCASEELCNLRCGAYFDSSQPCSCSTSCAKYGDCCPDYIGSCASADSCELRCEEQRNDNNTCHCDEKCLENNDCCDDFLFLCQVDVSEYYCSGECDVDRAFCSCKPNCVEEKTCCPDYSTTCDNKKAWHEEECTKNLECPVGYDNNIVILFSIDGFRAEYIDRGISPNIWKLASCGVHAQYQRSAYPTKTFPNHYTIATGLYPESHGIIDNTIYDHDAQKEFKLGSATAFESFWWKGEPMWITSRKQGKKSACYFWPGSDVDLEQGYPDYWQLYDGDVAFEKRMYGALDWLDLPADERPSFITLYIENVDHAGHTDGPVSEEVDKQIKVADDTVGFLMEGLKVRGLENCVNIIIVADHGMAPISCDRKNSVEDYGVDPDTTYIRSGAFGRVGRSKDESEADLYDAEKINDELRCTRNQSHWLSYLKYEDLPKRFHYANSDRIEDVILDVDDTWLVEGRKGSYTSCNGGNHGYDNEFKNMQAVFLSHGPQMKQKLNSSRPHEGIEVYNLMADILGVNPAPNNGTHGSMNYMMKNPPKVDSLSRNAGMYECTNPYNNDTMDCPSCDQKPNYLSPEDAAKYRNKHLLHGQPIFEDSSDYCLLEQKDYVNAYDKSRKIPYFVAYLLEKKDRNLESLDSNCVSADSRLSSSAMTSCHEYENDDDITWVTLYPEELSNGDDKYDARILSNLVPVYSNSVPVWKYLTQQLSEWSQKYNGVHVISGPVFDYNFDGHPDNTDQIKRFVNDDSSSTPVPSHYFFVIKRCTKSGKKIEDCLEVDDIDVLSYIIPNFSKQQCDQIDEVSTDWVGPNIIEHVARVRDVEIITGLSLLSIWGVEEVTESERLRRIDHLIRLPQFDDEWFNGKDGKANGATNFNISKMATCLMISISSIFILMF